MENTMYTLQVLQGFEGPALAYDLNARGDVCGAVVVPSGSDVAFVGTIWRYGLPILSLIEYTGRDSSLYGINDSTYAVGQGGILTQVSFSLLPRLYGSIESQIDDAIGPNGRADDINNSGHALCLANDRSACIADTVAHKIVASIPTPGGGFLLPVAINARGDVVLNHEGSDSTEALTSIGGAAAQSLGARTLVFDLNDRGTAVGTVGGDGVIWDDIRSPGAPPRRLPAAQGFPQNGVRVVPLGINNRGQIVGELALPDDTYRAFISDGSVVHDLNPFLRDAGPILTSASRINDAGDILVLADHDGLLSPGVLLPWGWTNWLHPAFVRPIGTVVGGAMEGGQGWIFVGGHWQPGPPRAPRLSEQMQKAQKIAEERMRQRLGRNRRR
jgi:hypothetical protein